MFRQSCARLGMLMVAAGLISACNSESPAPLAPGGRPSLATTSQTETAAALTRVQPLFGNITVGVTIGRQGGSFMVPGAGLRVTVPAGAVHKTTFFTVTALKGELVAYEFGPHGASFDVPLMLTQDLRGTTWSSLPDPSVMEAGYFQSARQLDYTRKQAAVDEFLPTNVDVTNSKLRFDVHHFSGYMVSSGRIASQ